MKTMKNEVGGWINKFELDWDDKWKKLKHCKGLCKQFNI